MSGCTVVAGGLAFAATYTLVAAFVWPDRFPGRGEWIPSWLLGWAYLAGAFGLLSLVVLYIPPLADLGFLIVPIGIAWMLAAGVVLLRQIRRYRHIHKSVHLDTPETQQRRVFFQIFDVRMSQKCLHSQPIWKITLKPSVG